MNVLATNGREQRLDRFRRDWLQDIAISAQPSEARTSSTSSRTLGSTPTHIPGASEDARARHEPSSSRTTIFTPINTSDPSDSSNTVSRPNFDMCPPSSGTLPAASRRQSVAIGDVTVPDRDKPKHLVLGTDFGFTFTSLSYFIHPIGDPNPQPFKSDIRSAGSWPRSPLGSLQIPSESWYSSVPMKRKRSQLGNPFNADTYSFECDEPTWTSKIRSHVSDSSDDEIDDNDFSGMDDDQSPDYLWGYEVSYQQYTANTSRSSTGRVKCSKSWLLDTVYTKDDRKILGPILDGLIERNIIRKFGNKKSPNLQDVTDVIADFLTPVYKHFKERMIILYGFSDQWLVDFVATVPTIWSPKASRVLQTAMAAAIQRSGVGNLGNGSIDNLFIISEPEAAATYLLATSNAVMAGDTFCVLDCGGGTVDAVTYTVSSTYPLRVIREEVPPDGGACGASYLNKRYQELLHERLRDETYLLRNGETLEHIVNRVILEFENDHKRNVDITRRCGNKVYIAGLVGDAAKRFEENKLLMHRRDYKTIFQPLLDEIQGILAKQLRQAHEKDKAIKKVFLIGGFGDSPSLRSHLQIYLDYMSNQLPYNITLVTDDQNAGTAVSRGAVLRAMNKGNGPDRIAQSSYGFLRLEPYDPEEFAGHKCAKPFTDTVDGERYVRTIVYSMIKGVLYPDGHEFEPLISIHTIPVGRVKLLCQEFLYVSDHATKSHYTRTNDINRDAQIEGEIVVDMSFLRDEGIIQPTWPADGKSGRKHFKIEYELVARIEGRNLKYEARYPPGGEVKKSGQISIAAAFRPGTG